MFATTMRRHPRATAGGFTIAELTVVIVIIALLMTITVPAVSGIINSTRLATAGNAVVGHFSEAQQLASSRGKAVEVRIYQTRGDGDGGGSSEGSRYDAIMSVTHYSAGEADPSNPAQTLQSPASVVEGAGISYLPDGVVMMEEGRFSSLLDGTLQKGGQAASQLKLLREGSLEDYSPPGLTGEYLSFLFLPEGTNLPANQMWHLTLATEIDVRGEQLPKNYFTIQVDPVTGKITAYRP